MLLGDRLGHRPSMRVWTASAGRYSLQEKKFRVSESQYQAGRSRNNRHLGRCGGYGVGFPAAKPQFVGVVGRLRTSLLGPMAHMETGIKAATFHMCRSLLPVRQRVVGIFATV